MRRRQSCHKAGKRQNNLVKAAHGVSSRCRADLTDHFCIDVKEGGEPRTRGNGSCRFAHRNLTRSERPLPRVIDWVEPGIKFRDPFLCSSGPFASPREK